MPQEVEFNFKLGADPECVFIKGNQLAHAGELLDAIFGGSIHHKSAGEFGKDGHTATAELRPAPGNTPRQITDNIKSLITSFTDEEFCVDIITESKYKSIGGHIHFELPEHWSETKMQGLQAFLSAMYVPLFLGENKRSVVSRLRDNYGTFSQFKKHNPTNNVYTHEFRAPTAEWMTTEKLTYATFAYWFVVYNEYLKHPRKYKDLMLLNEASQKAMQVIALEKPELGAVYAQSIIKEVKTFEHYKDFKEEIDFVTNAKAVLKEKEKAQYSIRNGWGKKLQTVSSRDISKKYTVTQTEKPIKTEVLNIIKPHHNGDLNTEFFATALAMVQAHAKKRLKHEYFIYGAQNIKTPIVSVGETVLHGIDNAETPDSFTKLKNTIQKMTDKARERGLSNKTILIGLPRDMRESGVLAPFLKLIKECEKDALTEQSFVPSMAKDAVERHISWEVESRAFTTEAAPPSGFRNLNLSEVSTLT